MQVGGNAASGGVDLWQQAADSLPPSVIKILDITKTGHRDIASAALNTAQDKRAISLQKRWRIKRDAGHEDIIIRDVVEKIVQWIRRFKEVGDAAMQYQPGHAALPWAALRFLLQAAINETDVHVRMVEDLELVARLVVRFGEFEKLYLSNQHGVNSEFSNSLVAAYVAVLEFLAVAVQFFNTTAAIRALKAPFRYANESQRDAILSKESDVLKLANIIDAQRLVKIDAQVERVVDWSLASQKAVEEKRYRDILHWLSRVEYKRHHESHRQGRVQDTGQWLFQLAEFQSWATASSCSLLLVHGIPGCGKTKICSALIDKYLEESLSNSNSVPVAYFYCNASEAASERRTAQGVLRSLARQLTVLNKPQLSIHSKTLALYDRLAEEAKTDGFDVLSPNPSNCVDLIVAALEDNSATLVIDALDEIDDPKELIDSLHKITQKAMNVVKVMVTSRDNTMIMAMLSTPRSIRITNDLNKFDVRCFALEAVNKAIADHALLRGQVESSLKSRLVESLIFGAKEMFLWIKLQVLHICSMGLEQDVDDAINRLASSDLDDLYRATYDRILQAGDATKNIVIRSLSWLLYSQEELTFDLFLCAIDAKQPTSEILALCGGFVILDHNSDVLVFAHHSVREYLRQQSPFQPSPAQQIIAARCLAICSDPLSKHAVDFEPANPLYRYAALYWGHHAQAVCTDVGSTFYKNLKSFLLDDDQLLPLSAQTWMDYIGKIFGSLPHEHSQNAAMELVSTEKYLAMFPICVFGFLDILEQNHWPQDFDWNQRNDHGQTVLYAACYFGYTKIVASLLRHGASIDIDCGRLGSALHCAAFHGNSDVVNKLLTYGAKQGCGEKFANAIDAACRGNSEKVVLTILDLGMGVSSQAEFDETLDAISKAGFSKALDKVREHPLNAKANPAQTLQRGKKVITSGKVGALQSLLRRSDIADIVPEGGVALSALYGHQDMCTFLLKEQHMNVEEIGELGSPLRCAALNGHSEVCQLLLDCGAAINGNNRLGGALHAAAMKGHIHTVKLLVQAKADVNIRGGFFGTALQAAAYQGHQEIVSLLINHGANPDLSGFSKDAFHAAAEGGKYHIIQLLLNCGLVPSSPLPQFGTMHGRSPPPPRNFLRELSPNAAKRDPMRFLFNDAVDSTASGDGRIDTNCSSTAGPLQDYWSSLAADRSRGSKCQKIYLLEAAAALGHSETVLLILSQRCHLRVKDSAFNEALLAACKAGNTTIVKELTKWMVHESFSLQQALCYVVSYGQTTAVRILLLEMTQTERENGIIKALKSSMNFECLSRTPKSAFYEILDLLRTDFPHIDVSNLLQECLDGACDVDRGDIVQMITNSGASYSKERLAGLFTRTCITGRSFASQVLYKALQVSGVRPETLSSNLKIAIKRGHSTVAQFLLPMCLQQEEASGLRQIFLLASGGGLTGVVKQLIEDRGQEFLTDSGVLQQGLNISALNGHEDTCAYLISIGADPCRPELTLQLHEIMDNSGEDITQKRDRQLCQYGSMSPLESCAFGFDRCERQETFRNGYSSWSQQSLTLQLLIQSASASASSIPPSAVRRAAASCPPELFKSILEGSIMSGTQHEWDALLDIAAARECFSFQILLDILQVKPDPPLKREVLKRLLDRVIDLFLRRTGLPYDQPALLKSTNTLEDVFDNGPGAVVEFLLRHLPEQKAHGDQYGVLLQCAAAIGRIGLVELFLERDVALNAVGSYYGTALQAASRFGQLAVMNLLLQAGANSNVVGGRYHTALRAAVISRNVRSVELLLIYNADTEETVCPHYKGHEPEPRALQLAMYQGDVKIASALIAAGANVNVESGSSQNLLTEACILGNLDLIRAIIDADSNLIDLSRDRSCLGDINTDSSDQGPLHAAARHGRLDILELLLSRGLDPEAGKGTLESCLILAAASGDTNMIKKILSLKQNFSPDSLVTAAEEALKSSNPKAVITILSHGLGNCPETTVSLLKTVCAHEQHEIIDFLLENLSRRGRLKSALTEFLEGDHSMSCIAYMTVLQFVPCCDVVLVNACMHDYDSVVRVGLDEGLDPNLTDNKGRPALHYAAIHGSARCVQLLLERGARHDLSDPTYGVPLQACLDGCAAIQLPKDLLSKEALRHAKLLGFVEKSSTNDYIFQPPHRRTTYLKYRTAQQYDLVVGLLLAHDACANLTSGHFGTPLALCAFMGQRCSFETLLRYGAIANETGGCLHSPLEAAIRGNQLKLANDILSNSSEPPAQALHAACEMGNLSMVERLLNVGVDFTLTDGHGRTALQVSLANLAAIDEGTYFDWRYHPPDDWAILNLVLETDSARSIVDAELIEAAKMQDDKARERVFSALMARSQSQFIPDDAFIHLLKHERYQGESGVLKLLLKHHRIAQVTTGMIAASQSVETVEHLLEYDPSYQITSDTLNAARYPQDCRVRQTLLERVPALATVRAGEPV